MKKEYNFTTEKAFAFCNEICENYIKAFKPVLEQLGLNPADFFAYNIKVLSDTVYASFEKYTEILGIEWEDDE